MLGPECYTKVKIWTRWHRTFLVHCSTCTVITYPFKWAAMLIWITMSNDHKIGTKKKKTLVVISGMRHLNLHQFQTKSSCKWRYQNPAKQHYLSKKFISYSNSTWCQADTVGWSCESWGCYKELTQNWTWQEGNLVTEIQGIRIA